MKSQSRITKRLLLGSFIAFQITMQSDAFAGDPLMDRTGRTLEVSINGEATKSIPEKDIKDSQGTEAFEVFWSGSLAAGPLCIKLTPKDPRLGKPEKIDVLIHEIQSDRPHQRWKSYDTVPSTGGESMEKFMSEKGFCPTEYTLTERLRYPTLPPGEYVFRIAYWGVGNWDRQDVLVTLK